MPDHAPGDQVAVVDDAEGVLAVAQELAVPDHGTQAALQGEQVGLRGQLERGGDPGKVERGAVSGQGVEDELPTGDGVLVLLRLTLTVRVPVPGVGSARILPGGFRGTFRGGLWCIRPLDDFVRVGGRVGGRLGSCLPARLPGGLTARLLRVWGRALGFCIVRFTSGHVVFLCLSWIRAWIHSVPLTSLPRLTKMRAHIAALLPIRTLRWTKPRWRNW